MGDNTNNRDIELTTVGNFTAIEEYKVGKRIFVQCECLLCGSSVEIRKDHFLSNRRDNCGCVISIHQTKQQPT